MIRLIHLLAVTVLIGSAAYAYSTKYETLYYAESLAKLKAKVQRERENIAIAKAEWAMQTRPDRLQKIVDKHLDLQPMTINQLARLSDIPDKSSRGDALAQRLESLMGGEPEATGSTARPKPKPPASAPKRDGIAGKLDSLGLGAKPPPKRTVAMAPPAKPPAAKPAATPKPAPAAPAAAQPKPAAR